MIPETDKLLFEDKYTDDLGRAKRYKRVVIPGAVESAIGFLIHVLVGFIIVFFAAYVIIQAFHATVYYHSFYSTLHEEVFTAEDYYNRNCLRGPEAAAKSSFIPNKNVQVSTFFSDMEYACNSAKKSMAKGDMMDLRELAWHETMKHLEEHSLIGYCNNGNCSYLIYSFVEMVKNSMWIVYLVVVFFIATSVLAIIKGPASHIPVYSKALQHHISTYTGRETVLPLTKTEKEK